MGCVCELLFPGGEQLVGQRVEGVSVHQVHVYNQRPAGNGGAVCKGSAPLPDS